MSFNVIDVKAHKRPYNNESMAQNAIKAMIHNTVKEFTPQAENTVHIYNMDAKFYKFNAGSRTRSDVFINATLKMNPTTTKQAIKFNGIEEIHDMLEMSGEYQTITDDNGVALAEFDEQYYDLYILAPLFTNQENYALLGYIMDKWNDMYWKKLASRSSWVHTDQRDKLILTFTERMRRAKEDQLADDIQREKRYMDKIIERKREIKSFFDEMLRLRNTIELEQANLSNVNTALIKDLDLIVNNPKISDLHIKDGKFHMHVPDVHAHTDGGKRYYIGNFRVEITLENADVKFFGDNPRQSYWTGTDPHPHVSGNTNRACLGNVESTIAELASRNEIYALALICVDFLEAVNLSDPAGRKVTNWDEVDKEGNVIVKGGENEPEAQCSRCDEHYNQNDLHLVYDQYDEDDNAVSEPENVCTDCRDNYYHYEESISEYVHD